MIEVRTAGKLGYCSGVSQAIEKAIAFAKENGRLYTLGTLAHNEVVVEYLEKRNVIPTQGDCALEGGNMAITAHGAPPETFERLGNLGCTVLDCTCPIVKKAQDKVRNLAAAGFDIVIFGDPNHQEVKGIVGWSMGSCKFVGHHDQLFTPGQEHRVLALGDKVGVVSQTTKDPADYRDFISTLLYHHLAKSSDVRIHNTICPIVAERIEETRKLAAAVDMMFVVGSEGSANTRNLERVCRQAITRAKGLIEPLAVNLVQNVAQVAEVFFQMGQHRFIPLNSIGVTAGTSTPIEVVEQVVAELKESFHES